MSTPTPPYPEQHGPPDRPPAWPPVSQPMNGGPPVNGTQNRTTTIVTVTAAVVALLCLVGSIVAVATIGTVEKEKAPAAAGSGTAGTTPTAAARPAAEPEVTAPEPTAPETIAPETSAPETTAPAPAAQLPADRKFTGRGAKVVRLKLPDDFIHIAKFTHSGSGNFAVWTVDPGGSQQDLLVNEIGKYAGTRLVDVRADGKPAALKVEAGGRWTITVQVAQKAPRWTGKGSGKGAAVLLVDPSTISGLATVRLTHKGEGNFAVWAYGDSAELLVNEIGGYSGETLMPDGTVLVDIEADGPWTLTKSS